MLMLSQRRDVKGVNKMTQSNVRTQQKINARSRNATTKARTQSRETPTIALKTIHDDIVRDNKNATITTKKMRARLRVALRDVHDHNASWMFTRSQYDVVRAMFDDAYAQKIARAKKRDASSRAKAQTQSRDDAQSNVVASDVNENA